MSGPGRLADFARRLRGQWASWAPLLAFSAVGLYLRWRQLPAQILQDDEWHAVRTAVRESYRQMATGFSTSAVPLLSMLYKLLHDSFGASELSFRMPMLLAGLALVPLFPLLVPGEALSARGKAALAGLLAISPLLVYFSRYARPYAISVLFSAVALLAFYHWWRREPGPWAWVFGVAGVLSPAFHLTTVSTVAAPFGWAFWQVWRGRGERTAREILLLGLKTGVPILLLVGPPILLDFKAIEKRAGANRVDLLTLRESLPLLAGIEGWAAWLVAAAAAVGLWALWRRAPRLASMLGFATLATLAVTTLSGANSVQVPIVFVRYSLWLAPAFLLLAAAGLGALLDRVPAWAAWPGLAAALALLFFGGPWPAVYGRVNSWTSHAIYQYTYRDDSPFSYERRPPLVPELYRRLAQEKPGSLVIAEAPFYSEWHNNPLAYYQEIHRQRVVAGMLGSACDRQAINTLPPGGTRLELRNTVDVSRRRDLLDHHVDLVIFHKNTFRELPRYWRNALRVPSSNLPPESGLVRCLPKYRQVLGKPFYEDDTLVAFDFRLMKDVTFDEKLLFQDGFESGDTRGWSRVSP